MTIDATPVTTPVASIFDLPVAAVGKPKTTWMLFVDKNPPMQPGDDLGVTDFSGAFKTAQAAAKYYRRWYAPYGKPGGLVAAFDGSNLRVAYRTEPYYEGDAPWEYDDLWFYQYDDME